MKGSRITGLDYEIIRNAFETQSLDISVALHPWDECIERVSQGVADGVFQIARTPERERRFLFSDILRIAKTVFYCNKAKPVMLGRDDRLIEKLQGTKIAVVKGYSYGPELDNLHDIPKISVGNHQEALLELSANKVDLAIIDEGVGVYLADVLMLGSKLQRVANFQIDRPLFVAFHRTRLQIRERFNSGLGEIRKNGIYDELMSKYNLK